MRIDDIADDEAVFARVVAATLRDDGLENDEPTDPAALTRFGFCLRYNGDLTRAALLAMTAAEAKRRYLRMFWLPNRYGELPEPISTRVFAAAVPHGPEMANRALQRALRACGFYMKEDGRCGTTMIGAVHDTPLDQLLPSLRSEIAALFRVEAAIFLSEPPDFTAALMRSYS